MDDKRTPMEAEVQELPVERELVCPENSYGTAVKPTTKRSHVGFWIWVGLAVIAVCTVCVVTAVKHVSVETGENGFRFAFHLQENTDVTEETVQNLEDPDAVSVIAPSAEVSDKILLPMAPAAGEARTPAEIYSAVSSAVVCVELDSYYSTERCTGVVISSNGCILSASDSLDSAISITVSFPDGTVLSAKRLGEDSISGVCLLKVEAEGLPTVCFAEDSEPIVGQSVYSVCNPYGSQIPNVFRDGMISVCSSAQIEDRSFRLIQSTAGPQSVEYGCPILDEHGLVLGITTPIGQRFVYGSDPCFALSCADLSRIAEDIGSSVSESSVWLGFEVASIREDYLDFFRFPGSIWIQNIYAGSPSYGKLLRYDIITSVDGIEISSVAEYEAILATHEPGDHVLLTIYRSGRISSYYITVMAR